MALESDHRTNKKIAKDAEGARSLGKDRPGRLASADPACTSKHERLAHLQGLGRDPRVNPCSILFWTTTPAIWPRRTADVHDTPLHLNQGGGASTSTPTRLCGSGPSCSKSPCHDGRKFRKSIQLSAIRTRPGLANSAAGGPYLYDSKERPPLCGALSRIRPGISYATVGRDGEDWSLHLRRFEHDGPEPAEVLVGVDVEAPLPDS